MKKEVKTNKEIFEQKYPLEEIAQNQLSCAEAIGYLRALNEYFPSEQNWTESKIAKLLILLLLDIE